MKEVCFAHLTPEAPGLTGLIQSPNTFSPATLQTH